MKHKYLNQIKSLEGPPKKVNIFSEKEIKMMQESLLYLGQWQGYVVP